MVKSGILNNKQLRHKNEPARHKLLDLMGDLALAGVALKRRCSLRVRATPATWNSRGRSGSCTSSGNLSDGTSRRASSVVFDITALQNILPTGIPSSSSTRSSTS